MSEDLNETRRCPSVLETNNPNLCWCFPVEWMQEEDISSHLNMEIFLQLPPQNSFGPQLLCGLSLSIPNWVKCMFPETHEYIMNAQTSVLVRSERRWTAMVRAYTVNSSEYFRYRVASLGSPRTVSAHVTLCQFLRSPLQARDVFPYVRFARLANRHRHSGTGPQCDDFITPVLVYVQRDILFMTRNEGTNRVSSDMMATLQCKHHIS